MIMSLLMFHDPLDRFLVMLLYRRKYFGVNPVVTASMAQATTALYALRIRTIKYTLHIRTCLSNFSMHIHLLLSDINAENSDYTENHNDLRHQ